jgi:hypothetical protein
VDRRQRRITRHPRRRKGRLRHRADAGQRLRGLRHVDVGRGGQRYAHRRGGAGARVGQRSGCRHLHAAAGPLRTAAGRLPDQSVARRQLAGRRPDAGECRWQRARERALGAGTGWREYRDRQGLRGGIAELRTGAQARGIPDFEDRGCVRRRAQHRRRRSPVAAGRACADAGWRARHQSCRRCARRAGGRHRAGAGAARARCCCAHRRGRRIGGEPECARCRKPAAGRHAQRYRRRKRRNPGRCA